MKKITPTTEKKLLSVIEKTAALVSAGEQPNDAIVKTATDAGLRPGEINLVIHAFNTGRTNRQRIEGEDPFTKSAEFNLADPEVILERLYPSNVKTASAVQRETVISTDYGRSPQSMLARKQSAEKRAHHVDWRQFNGSTIPVAEPLPEDDGAKVKRAMAHISRLKIEVEEARRKQANAFDKLGDAFLSLTSYFRQPDSKSIPVVKEAVMLLHGDKGEQIMDELVKVTPALTKLANHRLGNSVMGVPGREKFASVESLDCTEAPFPMIADMVRLIDEYKEKKAAHDELFARHEKEAHETIAPFDNPLLSHSILGGSSDSGEKRAFDPLRPLGAYSLIKTTMGDVANRMKGPDDTASVASTINSLEDPEHENKLRGINSQAMLQDLMLNDDVISGFNPDQVANAYNDIVQISPSVADQRMLVQNLLRKKLQQGQLDTFEQDQLLGFEDKLRRQNTPMPGNADASII